MHTYIWWIGNCVCDSSFTHLTAFIYHLCTFTIRNIYRNMRRFGIAMKRYWCQSEHDTPTDTIIPLAIEHLITTVE